MKFFKKMLSTVLATSMLISSFTVVNTSVASAALAFSAGWNESLYAEWPDANPDSTAVKVGYKLSSASSYTYLEGDDLTYLVRPASTSGLARVDIPGLTAGRYDLSITGSDGQVHERKGIKVYAYDRSGYAHFNRTATEAAATGVGAYKDDGTLKDNAIVIYVTDENKDTVQIPGYENTTWSYTPSSSAPYTRTSEGIGNILNNNMKFISQVTITDNHPLVVRFIGKVTVPKNLTPYNVKDPILGGAKGDNGNLAICKWGRNITLEGIGADAELNGWGFTASKTATHPAESGQSYEVRNLTLRDYTEDGLGFQGEGTAFAERVWVHNNVFYPGHCANPAESDKGDGDGSCDFKRGKYYTMSYNHFVGCHKTNLLGSGGSDDQWYMTLHHNWYENVGSRQPLAANGNMHIYSTYFQGATSTSVDTRASNAAFLEENYYENCKSLYKSRNNTCVAKSYNEVFVGGGKLEEKGTRTVVTDRTQSALKDNGYKFPDGTSMADFDMNPAQFYYDAANKVSAVEVLTPAAEVPEYVKTYAGTLKQFPEVESGEVVITVKADGKAVTDATVTAPGLTFKNNGDGTYTATASLGAEYMVTVSKEGFSNEVITTTAIANDGEQFKADANLKADYDGYAVVKLVGGNEKTPVTGATVTLADGTALVEQGNGIYKSASQIAVGTTTVTITNTGDYIAPTTAQTITVKTTDAETEIALAKAQGQVSVTLVANAEATKALDASTALVYVGSTQLTYTSNNTFTGSVDVSVPLDVTASLPGWKIESITPAKLTATKEGVASATITLAEGGAQYTWDATTGNNTEEFFQFVGTFDSWSGASKEPQTFEGETYTNALKFSSGKQIQFTAPSDGELVILAHNRNKTAQIKINDGTAIDIAIGTNTIPVKAGLNTIARVKGEPCLYLMRYTVGGGGVVPPVPPVPTESTTGAVVETTTEATTEKVPEVSTETTPVEFGAATNNNGEAGISVVYDATTNSWKLTDTSTTLAANLTLPLAAPITSGKVIIKGQATPSAASGKWAFVKVLGKFTDATGVEKTDEFAALASNASKQVTLRTDGVTYTPTTAAIAANKTYNYEFIIDLDNKTVSLDIDGTVYTGTTTATEITGFGSITSAKSARNVTVTVPYVGIIKDAPAGLNDEIMWDVTNNMTEGSNGLTIGETFYTNTEEVGPVQFVEGPNTYDLDTWLQPKTNPLDERGMGPMSVDTVNNRPATGIPVSGGFAKYTPEKDGVFTMAVKTNGGKTTYVTDETGAVVKSIVADSTRYDIVRFNVKAGKSYNIFAQGSKTCLYYLGYTSGISVPEEPTTEATTVATTEATTEATTAVTTEPTTAATTEATTAATTEATTAATTEPTTVATTEATTEPTTAATTEATTEPTTEPPVPVTPIYGDADADNDVDIVDVAMILSNVLTGKPFKNTMEYVDVDKNSKIDTADVAAVLQHILDKAFTLPR